MNVRRAKRGMRRTGDKPNMRSIAQRKVRNQRERTAPLHEVLEPGEKPIATAESVLHDVGCFRLEHQFRDIYVGRTLDRAHLAIDTQVGDVAYVIGAELPALARGRKQ